MQPEKILAAIVLISLTLGAGLQVDRDHLKAVLRNVGLLGRALLANFIVVPALGVLLAKLFRLPPHVATGFLLMAIAPGVPFILSSVRKKGGRLSLAVELAVFLPLLSIVTVPLTAALVLPESAQSHVPLLPFAAKLLVFQLVPLLAGIAIGARLPQLATRLARPLQIVFIVSTVVLLAFVAPQIPRAVASVSGSLGLLAMLCLALLSMLAGWLLGGPAVQDRRVLATATTLRNVGLAALIATTSFGNPAIAAAVLTYLLVQVAVSAAFGVYFMKTAAAAAA